MIEHDAITSFNSDKPSVITIGTFDGVHIGHKAILKQLITTAKKDGLQSIVLTFFPHPRMVLQKNADIKLINTISERKFLLEKTGLEHLIIQPFTKEFSRLTAIEFVRDILVNQLHLKKIIIGYDHRFGRNRNANIDDLIEFGKLYDFEVVEISAQQLEEVSVSSTKIRSALANGNIEIANSYLGQAFSLSGTVVSGRGIGKSLNFPTANLQVAETYKIIPKEGVYLVSANLFGEKVYGLTNIGTNPTVNGTHQTIETYFLDLTQDLYQQNIQIDFISRIRDEQKFNSVEELVKAIQKDEIYARKLIASHE